jgi:23S rRNA (uracil1939-C5)-methyltransferase
MDEEAVRLAGYAYGGEALGRLADGRMVFVPFALPGETVRLRLVEEKRGYARAQLLDVLQAAPERIPPRCAHFGVCGGCHYQHLPYPEQLRAKSAILRDQLERIGGLLDPPLGEIVPSPEPFNYRNHVQFHLTADGKLGYHLQRSAQVLAIQECHLPEPALGQVWPLLDFEAMPEIQRLSLRLGAGEDVQLTLESDDPQLPEINVEDLPLSVVHLSQGDALVLAGSSSLVIEVLGRSFAVSAGSFFQVNTGMAEKMVTHVLSLLESNQAFGPDKTLVDVYCGVGLFSAFIAPQVGRLIGIEASPSAAEDFTFNLDEFNNVELYEAPAELVLPQLDILPSAVLVDPPREGLDRQTMDGLLKLRPPLLVYVSCDPSTLARDARRLHAAGYRLEQVTPFDLFPQTYHIESISFWSFA